MGHPDGAHTHGSGGSRLPEAVVMLIVAALVVRVGAAVLTTVAEVVHILLIVAAVILGLVAVGLVAFIAVRVRRRAVSPVRYVPRPPPVARRPAQALPEPRPAIERPAELHLHLHGLDAEDVAAIVRQHGGIGPPPTDP